MFKKIMVCLLFIVVSVNAFAANAWFAPYVDVSGWPKPNLQQLTTDSGNHHYTLAFLVDKTGSSCIPGWGTYYDLNYMQDDVVALRNMGGDVMISLGGAANTPLAAGCKTSQALANAYENIVSTYQLTKLDFDIEGYWASESVSLKRRVDALKIMQQNYPNVEIWLTLPVLPSGLSNDGIHIVDQMVAAGVNIAGVNIMAMDYSDNDAPNPDGQMGSYAIKAATALHAQLTTIYQQINIAKSDAQIWQMIGITPMIGLNDVTTEKFYTKDAQQVVDFAKQNQLPFIGMWSMNRDHQCSPVELPYVNLHCSGVPQAEYGFSAIFNQL